eukprot:9476895-Pyramimonas_sp.AAC.1
MEGSRPGRRRVRRLHGKGVATFLARLPDCDFEDLFLGGKGRDKGRRHTTGKRKGRRPNPVGNVDK